MEYIKTFENFQPNEQSVNDWLPIIKNKYPIINSEWGVYIVIDDKSYYLRFGKNNITNRIYYDILNSDEMIDSKIHEPSLRKAIKSHLSFE